MPCSCGNTICACGIPCYCSKELCKCQDCAIALCPFCKICNKPLVTDIQTGENKCSCFVGDSTVLMFENRVDPQWRMGNISMPVGYVVPAKLIINVMIPVMNFPEFVPKRPISLIPSSPSIQADSRKILPSFISDSVVNPLYNGEDNGLLSTAELHESSNMRSNVAQITKSFNKETCPPPVLQSTDEANTINVLQNSKSETDDTLVQELSSFYLPSVRIGDISYPVGLEDPVWRLPNPYFCTENNLDPTLKLYNPFYMPEPAYRTQTVTAFEKDCHQPASNLNFYSNVSAKSDSFVPQMRQQPSFNILREPAELEELSTIARGNGSTSSLTSGNSEENMHANRFGDLYFYNSPKYLISDIATQISSFREQKLPSVPSQPVCTDSTSTFGKNDYIRICHAGCYALKPSSMPGVLENAVFRCSHMPTVSSVGPAAVSKFQSYFNQNSTPSSEGSEYPRSGNNSSDSANKINEGNEYPRSGNNSSDSANKINEGNEYPWFGNNSSYSSNKINEEDESIPLYIDTSTTEKMGKLLKFTEYSRDSAQIFTDIFSPMRNSTNINVPNCASSMYEKRDR